MRHRCTKCGNIECVPTIKSTVLAVVERHGPCSTKFIHGRLHLLVDYGSVNAALKQLEHDGFVERERGTDVPRSKSLYRVPPSGIDKALLGNADTRARG